MKLFIFELNKIWRQRNFIYLMLITVLFISGLFFYHHSKQDEYVEREREILDLYSTEIGALQNNIRQNPYEPGQKSSELGGMLTEHEKNQLTELERAAAALFSWKVALSEGHDRDIPNFIQIFIISINAYEELGGSFEIFPAEERAIAWMKNEWMLEHDLIYVDEIYPMTPMPLLKESGHYLFQIPGLLLLLFIFGMTISKEKEEETWRTLQTQPIRNRHIYMGKYGSLLVITCFYACFTIIYTICLPLLFGQDPVLHYPQLISIGDKIEIMSSFTYILRMIILFIGVMFFVYSLAFLVSTFVRQTFTMLAVTTFIIFIGYYSTVFIPFLQNVWNPFHIMQFSALLNPRAHIPFEVYVMSSIVWAITLFVASVYLSEKRWQWQAKMFKDQGKQKHISRDMKKIPFQSDLSVTIQFEIKKLKRKGLLGKVIILFVLLIAFGFLMFKMESKEREKNYLATVEYVAEGVASSYLTQELEEAKKLFRDDKVQLELSVYNIEELLKVTLEMEDKAEKALISYDKGEWTALYEYQRFINRRTNGEFPFHGSGKDTFSQFTIDASLMEKQWLIDHNVTPIFGGGDVITLFYDFYTKKGEREWLEEQKRVDANGLFSIYFYINHYVYFLVIAFLLFLLGAGFSDERGKKRTIHFLQTMPLYKQSLFLGKALTALCISFFTILLLFGIVLLTSTIFDRFGDWAYPILYYDHKQIVQAADYSGHTVAGFDIGFHFIPLGDYVLHGFGLLVCVGMFIVTVGIFLSIFIRKPLAVFTTTIVISGLGYLTAQYASGMAHWLPFTYFDISGIINGELAILSNNPALTTHMGLFVLSLSSALLLFLGWGTFKIQRSRAICSVNSLKSR